MRTTKNSERLFKLARRYLPGGVDSPVRAFGAVESIPRFIVEGNGSKIRDADGNSYIDYVCSWGPLILGHAERRIVEALRHAAGKGTSFGAVTELETRLAAMICKALPSMEMVRFVSSGTEAAMSAIRLARAFTGRDRIIKFAGCYHGHCDSLLVSGGSGMATLGIPDSPGVTASTARDTLVAGYNDLDSVRRLFAGYPDSVAAVIVEPIAANMGLVHPASGFLSGLQRLARANGALLIFDEVITGFRVAYGGAQQLYKIRPDLTCLGKIIGGGLPVGAYGGRRDIMQMVAPSGKVYQAGTLSGNPLAVTAGITTLEILRDPSIYKQLEDKGDLLQEGLAASACDACMPLSIARQGSLLTVFFSAQAITDYTAARSCDTAVFGRFFRGMLEQGIYWPPSQFEAAFLSLAHSRQDISVTVKAARQVLKQIQD
ncbi:MAG: glutamate-1-semialdehyde 2,1-aminomutase [Dehalococcoidia bacterium]|nr:glutamate-1-semialdehyde 2,1-aminomutase [Dehalococcoidia bacterium]